jgi:hypothetical protein
MQKGRMVCVCLAILLALFVFGACADKPAALDVRTLCVAQGGAQPSASDFLTDEAQRACAEQGMTVAFAVAPDFSALGEGNATLVLTDARGRATEQAVSYTVVADVTPPELLGVRALSMIAGDGAVLREGVSAIDDCFGEVTLSVDASELDTSRPGMYSVTYRAIDAVGNATEQTAYVTVYSAPFDEGKLIAACDEILARIAPDTTDRERVCRAVYAYVQDALSYFPVSDHSHAGRAALTALEHGRGDCFSYFALAKALLERAGIPCLEIERPHKAGEQTHFWLMVDLDRTGRAPRWYHFDPTELDATQGAHDGCLFTDAQLDVYNTERNGFYDYDRAAYPATALELLTPTAGKEGQP